MRQDLENRFWNSNSMVFREVVGNLDCPMVCDALSIFDCANQADQTDHIH